MRVSLRPHESGNPNHLLRGDGKYIGVQPQQFLDYLLNPENLPGLLEWVDVEDLPDGYILSGKGTLHEGTGPRVEVHHRQTGRR